MNKEILDMAKIICKSCYDSKDSVFDCNASKRPCESAINHAKSLYKQGYRRIYIGNPLCPVCGKKMDGTEHGRQYCESCREQLEQGLGVSGRAQK